MGEARFVPPVLPATVLTALPAQDQLIDVFKSVGQVVGFRCVRSLHEPLAPRSLTRPPSRLVFDRETGKPKGYGFCEFAGTSHVPFSSCQSSRSLSDSPSPD